MIHLNAALRLLGDFATDLATVLEVPSSSATSISPGMGDDQLQALGLDPTRIEMVHALEQLSGLLGGLTAQEDQPGEPQSEASESEATVVQLLSTLSGAPPEQIQAVMQTHGRFLPSIDELMLQRTYRFSPAQARKMVAAVRLALQFKGIGQTPFDGPKDHRRRSAAEVRDYVLQKFPADDYEVFGVLFLDAKSQIISGEAINKGGLSSSLVDVRRIVRRALDLRAAGLILFHNHPSGDPSASPEDFAITTRINQACEPFGIRVVDHVVVGATGGYYSFAETGQMPGADAGMKRIDQPGRKW